MHRDRRACSQAVVILPDTTVRTRIAEECQASGLNVLAVSSTAQIERWPIDQIVITDADHFSGWWNEIGASEIVVLARDPREGEGWLQQGATRWLLNPPTRDAIRRMVGSFDATRPDG